MPAVQGPEGPGPQLDPWAPALGRVDLITENPGGPAAEASITRAKNALSLDD
ncbi:hypothetical protein [Streptomyces sp. NPDC088184]|uniref:hypothetical protein n=1 Tax=unclassified Streptomyces TaxID=2593676 RepID=UPI003442ACC2